MNHILFAIIYSVAASNEVKASAIGFEQGSLRKNSIILNIDARGDPQILKP